MKIKIPKVVHYFKPVEFVCQARAKENTRYSISYVLVEKDCFVATDGRRLHIAYFKHKYETGLYEVVKKNKSLIVLLKVDTDDKFPKWRDIIPKHQRYFELYSDGGVRFIESTLILLGKNDVMLNLDFIKPLDSLIRQWEIYFGTKEQPARFISAEKDNRVEAVVMPVNHELDKIKFMTKTQKHRAKKTKK